MKQLDNNTDAVSTQGSDSSSEAIKALEQLPDADKLKVLEYIQELVKYHGGQSHE